MCVFVTCDSYLGKHGCQLVRCVAVSTLREVVLHLLLYLLLVQMPAIVIIH